MKYQGEPCTATGAIIDPDVSIPARYSNSFRSGRARRRIAWRIIDTAFVNNVPPGRHHRRRRELRLRLIARARPHRHQGGRAWPCVIASELRAHLLPQLPSTSGLPILECPEAARDASAGDEMEVDLAAGTIKNLTLGKTYSVPPFPPEIRAIIARGGLLNKA